MLRTARLKTVLIVVCLLALTLTFLQYYNNNEQIGFQSINDREVLQDISHLAWKMKQRVSSQNLQDTNQNPSSQARGTSLGLKSTKDKISSSNIAEVRSSTALMLDRKTKEIISTMLDVSFSKSTVKQTSSTDSKESQTQDSNFQSKNSVNSTTKVSKSSTTVLRPEVKVTNKNQTTKSFNQTTKGEKLTTELDLIIAQKIKSFKESEIPPKDLLVMNDLLETLWKVKKAKNFTGIFLYGGTLLGSWRHHGFIPYDDDIDVAAPADTYEPLLKSLNELGPKYVAKKAGWRIKFFSEESKHKTPYSWMWPYVDLQFYKKNATHLWDAASEFSSYKYNVTDTFPLKLRPFEKGWYEAPRRPDNFLKAYYGNLDWCKTGWYSHKFEKGQQTHEILCDKLKSVYPFVESREEKNGKDSEVLKFGGKVVREVVFPT